MRDIMMNKRNPEMQDGEMDVLEQYADIRINREGNQKRIHL